MEDIEFTGRCDFCREPVSFYRVTHHGGFWFLAPFEANAGSDYLAIWCASCGPVHRANNRFFVGVSS